MQKIDSILNRIRARRTLDLYLAWRGGRVQGALGGVGAAGDSYTSVHKDVVSLYTGGPNGATLIACIDDVEYVLAELDPVLVADFYARLNRDHWFRLHGLNQFATSSTDDADIEDRFLRALCEALLKLVGRNTRVVRIFAQDYQCQIGAHLRAVLRAIRPDVRLSVTQFVHTPYPAEVTADAAATVSRIRSRYQAVDDLGFHTTRWMDRFIADAMRHGSRRIDGSGPSLIDPHGHVTQLHVQSLGISWEFWRQQLFTAGGALKDIPADLPELPDYVRINANVGRGDITKNLGGALQALRLKYRNDRSQLGRELNVFIAAPTREKVPVYGEYYNNCRTLAEEINEEFGLEVIRWISTGLPPRLLAWVYRIVGLSGGTLIVPSFADGKVLVCEECMICNTDVHPPVVALSTQTGAHDQFGTATLPLCPTDVEQMADSLSRASRLTPRDRRKRFLDFVGKAQHVDVWSRYYGACMQTPLRH